MHRPNLRALLTLALALLAGACTEDSDGVSLGPGGDANGSWVVQRATGVTYLRVLPNTVEMYVESDTCFEKTDYTIEAIDGTSFTLASEDGGISSTWSFERIDESLVVTMGATAMTLEPVALDLGTLEVCGGPEPDFPHPPCSEIPEVEVGGSVTDRLEPGDARWTDGTWYDLWSLQLDSDQTVTISMSAEDPSVVDTYLMLYDPAGVDRIAVNDDIDYDAGNYDSSIEAIDLDAGCYIIVANSYSETEDEAGGYTLAVQ